MDKELQDFYIGFRSGIIGLGNSLEALCYYWEPRDRDDDFVDLLSAVDEALISITDHCDMALADPDWKTSEEKRRLEYLERIKK